MPLRRRSEELAPPRTHGPVRQVVVFPCITYAIALAVALALPRRRASGRPAIAPRVTARRAAAEET